MLTLQTYCDSVDVHEPMSLLDPRDVRSPSRSN